MPKYRVLEKSFIGRLIDPETDSEADCIIDYPGEPGANLEPLDDEAKAAYAKAFPDSAATKAAKK